MLNGYTGPYRCARCMDTGCGDCSGRVDAEDRYRRKLGTHALKDSDNFPIGYALNTAKPGYLLTVSMNAKEALQKDTRNTLEEYRKFPAYIEEMRRCLTTLPSTILHTPTPTKMQTIRRLLDFNDWTIALLYDEPGHQIALIAFDGEGAYRHSREYKITVDDTAFEWRGGKLYSGKLEYTPTERDIAREEVEKAREVARKHNDRIQKQMDKLARKMK